VAIVTIMVLSLSWTGDSRVATAMLHSNKITRMESQSSHLSLLTFLLFGKESSHKGIPENAVCVK
jgi:hypothetical protein